MKIGLFFLLLVQILHFFNTPPHMTEDMLGKVFEEKEAPCPKTIKLFPLKCE